MSKFVDEFNCEDIDDLLAYQEYRRTEMWPIKENHNVGDEIRLAIKIADLLVDKTILDIEMEG